MKSDRFFPRVWAARSISVRCRWLARRLIVTSRVWRLTIFMAAIMCLLDVLTMTIHTRNVCVHTGSETPEDLFHLRAQSAIPFYGNRRARVQAGEMHPAQGAERTIDCRDPSRDSSPIRSARAAGTRRRSASKASSFAQG